MGNNYSKSLVRLFAVVIVALVSIASAQAQVAWVTQSIFAFRVTNNTNTQADQFQLNLKGVDMWMLDQQQCVSSNYGACNVTEDWDQNVLHITWSQGSTPAGQSSDFEIVVNHYVSLQSCDMVWTDSNGTALGHIDDVWQDWTISGSGVYGTIHNRTNGTRYVQRMAGYGSDLISPLDLTAISIPPNATLLDPTGPFAISAGSSATYDYSPYYLANRTNFMFYQVYADSSATTPLIGVRTAAITTIPAGGISFVPNVNIDSYVVASPTQRPYYEVVSVRAMADPYEDLHLGSVDISSDSNSGNPTDVTVGIWKDVNNDGKVDTSVDQLLGSAVLSAGRDRVNVQITPSVTIPKGGEMDLVVTYALPASAPVGSDFYAGLGDAYAVGNTTGIRVPVTSDSVDGASIMIAPPAATIGDAKKLPINPATGATDVVLIKDAVITAYYGDIVYVEDENRASGIGVRVGNDRSDFTVGMKVSVMGRIVLNDGVEAMLDPIDGVIGDIVTPLTPLMMTNKSLGGGAFGIQPAVMDDALTNIPAKGLNNIGKLVKTCGQVTGTATLEVGEGEIINVAWIDDGSGLQDGVSGNSGVAVMMPTDWDGTPLSGQVAVTGIIRPEPSPAGKIIKVLFPRSMADIKSGS